MRSTSLHKECIKLRRVHQRRMHHLRAKSASVETALAESEEHVG
jgi:hypothetical protein